MSSEIEKLLGIFHRSLKAAGLPADADAELLPERIAELRFIGSTFVSRAPYPRSGVEKDRPVESTRGGARIDRTLKSLAV